MFSARDGTRSCQRRCGGRGWCVTGPAGEAARRVPHVWTRDRAQVSAATRAPQVPARAGQCNAQPRSMCKVQLLPAARHRAAAPRLFSPSASTKSVNYVPRASRTSSLRNRAAQATVLDCSWRFPEVATAAPLSRPRRKLSCRRLARRPKNRKSLRRPGEARRSLQEQTAAHWHGTTSTRAPLPKDATADPSPSPREQHV